MAHPLNQLLRNGCPGELCAPPTTQELYSFDPLQRALNSAVILQLQKENQSFSKDTDDGAYHIRAALYTELVDGFRPPIGFHRLSILPTKRNFSASALECLAMGSTVQSFRPCLECKPFAVYTEHSALRAMFNLAEARIRLARCRLRFSDSSLKYASARARITLSYILSVLFQHTAIPILPSFVS